jgi:hypothetical protein
VTIDDIAALFRRNELDLIASLKRNLARHKQEEQKEGFSWPAWQAEKMKNLQAFRTQNKAIMERMAPTIDVETHRIMEEQFAEGRRNTDGQLADSGLAPPTSIEGGAAFFGVDGPRHEALIQDILQLEQRCESAALRTMDDVYRQTILRAELAMTTGATTLPTAIDMAVKDFLAKGINSIQYADGRRVNIADYAQMALRTAATRSKLQGEAARRAEYGVNTVLVSQYGACSETCMPWQGRVYIDDVWGGYTGETQSGRGKSQKTGLWHPLLSTAVENGLFHPNCRHTATTFVEGISTVPAPLDAEKTAENYKLEQQQRALERKIRKAKRMAEGLQDPAAVNMWKGKVKEAQTELRGFIAEHSDVLRRDPWRERVWAVSENPGLQTMSNDGKIDLPTAEAETTVLRGAIPKETGKTGVHFVGRIDRADFEDIAQNISTDEVIITDTQIRHIHERHPGDYEQYGKYIPEILVGWQIKLRDRNPNTALLLKRVEAENGGGVLLVLRLHTVHDDPAFKNSVISLWHVDFDRWETYSHSKKVVDMRE